MDRRPVLLLAATWLLTRAFLLSELGYLRAGADVPYQDVDTFERWAETIATTSRIPDSPDWQYPPAAVMVLLLPRLAPFDYGPAFVAMALLLDALVTITLVRLAGGGGRLDGAWLWVLAAPVLSFLVVLRFDTVPTAVAVLGLASASSMPRLGVLAGVGAMVKVWPVLILVAPATAPHARRALLWAGGTVLLLAVTSMLLLENAGQFLSAQRENGLHIEAVAATPWHLRAVVLGDRATSEPGNGRIEIAGPVADGVASGSRLATVVVGAAAVALAVRRWRTGRGHPTDAAPEALGRDAVFTAALLFVVVNPILSPQFLLWLVGLGAVALASPGCRVRRPVAAVAVAVLLSRGIVAGYGALLEGATEQASLLCLRNAALAFAAVDAAGAMVRAWRGDAAADPAAAAPSGIDRT